MLGIVFRGRVCPGHLFEALPGLEVSTVRHRRAALAFVPALLAVALLSLTCRRGPHASAPTISPPRRARP
jgi:hypothetical protein